MPKKPRRTIDAREAAALCARIADERKADDIIVLDLNGISPVADYFVIASGVTARQLKAISRDIEKEMKARHATRLGVEGFTEGHWILLDYGDLIVHLFLKDLREFYDLEMLWGDAPAVEWA